MAMLTVHNLPHEVHRALRVRAALRGHSMEAEVREILGATVAPEGRIRLGSLLADIGRTAKLTDKELASFGFARAGRSTIAAVLLAQAQDAEARPEALLGMGATVENVADEPGGVRSALFRPAHAPSGPLSLWKRG